MSYLLKIKYYLLFPIEIFFLSCNIEQKAYNASISGDLYRSNVWKADNGNGTYTNPILYADYSDPDVIRVGGDFYMTASTFNFSPGLPILHSKDLINWHIINYALPQLPHGDYDLPQYGKGVWAPCIRFHKGIFYIYWGDPDFGIYMVKSNNPAGKWSDPILVHGDNGMIDPSPFWDNDGNAYLVCAWAGSRSGINSILTLYKMSSDGTHLLDDGCNIYSGHGSNHTIEGPKLVKRNNYYYIFAPAGGVTYGWQVVLRSKNIYGPYEVKTVMAQGKSDINGPHQGGYVETPSGQPWFLHFQDKGAYGRILHLNPVIWMNDWPVIGEDKDGDGCGEPVRTYVKPDVHSNWPIMNPQESDEFNDKEPGIQWEWAGNKKITWSISVPNRGFLRLLAVPKKDSIATLWKTPNLMLQRFPAPSFTATTKLCLSFEWNVWQGKQAGLIIMGNSYCYLALQGDEKGYYVAQWINKDANKGGLEQCIEKRRIKSNEVYLRVKVNEPDALCIFSFSEDGISFLPIGIDFYAEPVLWSGSRVGIFCTSDPRYRIGGYADFDWFRIDK